MDARRDYDFDGNNENVLADITVGGVKRKVLMHADRNGFLYTLDRTNGKLIAANPYVNVNWAERIDLKRRARSKRMWRSACGRRKGASQAEVDRRQELDAHGIQSQHGRLYFAMLEETSVYQLNKELPVYKAGERYMGVEKTTAPRTPGEPWGYFGALDPLTRQAQVDNFR